MRKRKKINSILFCILLVLYLFIFNYSISEAAKKSKYPVVDYRKYLNRQFNKVKRNSTRFIIVHTSEAGRVSTLRTLSKGKRVGNHRTRGGHANFAIARDGYVYKILDHKYRADHTGLSMWNGITDLSSYSIGIELVGYHYGNITDMQYRSLSLLLKELQKIYKIEDKNVLTHCQVSYGKPNHWFHSNHRGRKRCALNFEPIRAGLRSWWTFDPDVRAGRLTSDFQISRIFYGRKNLLARKKLLSEKKTVTVPKKDSSIKISVASVSPVIISNVISHENTAWNIAGEDYNKPETSYILPNGSTVSGDKLGEKIGWDKIPVGTKIFLNHPAEIEKQAGPLLEIKGDFTAWSYAGKDYKKSTTFYFFPDGRYMNGDKLSDWDSFPTGVKMLIGYKGPFLIKPVKGKTAWGYAGRAYNKKETVYYIPGEGAITGDKMNSFNNLPKGSLIFMK